MILHLDSQALDPKVFSLNRPANAATAAATSINSPLFTVPNYFHHFDGVTRG